MGCCQYKNQPKGKKEIYIDVSQSVTQRFEGFYKNYVPITDIKSERQIGELIN